jgi:hypothetical protein
LVVSSEGRNQESRFGEDGDAFDFDEGVEGEPSDLDGGAGGFVATEFFIVDDVHSHEVVHGFEEHGGFGDVFEGEALGFKDGLDILEDLAGLAVDIVGDDFLFGGADGDLARAEEEVSSAGGVRVWAHGSGRFGCVDELHSIRKAECGGECKGWGRRSIR